MQTSLPPVHNPKSVCVFERGFQGLCSEVERFGWRSSTPIFDRELVDMFLGTLSGPSFNHLIDSSSVGFTELILTGERVEAGILSGKIQKDTSSSLEKKPFTGEKGASSIYSPRDQSRAGYRPTVSVVIILRPMAAP